MIRAYRSLRLALAFLTIIPIPVKDGEVDNASIADARLAYPVVGLLIGLILASLSECLRRLEASSGPSAFLLIATGVIMTGGLHLDGLADSADGLFLWGDADRRLTVMRDPRLGSFGATALMLVLVGKFASLEAMNGPGRSLALIGSATIARFLILVSSGVAPYARPEGTGRIVVDATRPRDALAAGLLAVLTGLATGGRSGLIAALFTVSIALLFTQFARRKLGGVTGDTLGALVELGELSTLLAMSLIG